MMKFKKILFSVLILVTNVCVAQQKETKIERIQSFVKTLSIDEEKANQIVNAIDKCDEQLQEILKKKEFDPKNQGLISKIIAEKQARIKSLLTNEQFAKLQELFKKHVERSKHSVDDIFQRNAEELRTPSKGGEVRKRNSTN